MLALQGLILSCAPRRGARRIWTCGDVNAPARALENTAFVAAVNRYGVEDQLVMPGHTKVCNPRGHVVAELAEEAEGVLHVELDLNEVVDYRQRSPYLRDRRPDLYDLVLLP